ncbi:MAG: hypothetical protein IH946_07400 [Bacteroidetes bacterium]|nr:hypothetical protein [Bacteroidota bacterium]
MKYTGYQPRGLSIDETNGLLYVANRNADPQGADVPHHFTDCEGNNGYVTLIDMSKLEVLTTFNTETSVDSFSMAIRQ